VVGAEVTCCGKHETLTWGLWMLLPASADKDRAEEVWRDNLLALLGVLVITQDNRSIEFASDLGPGRVIGPQDHIRRLKLACVSSVVRKGHCDIGIVNDSAAGCGALVG